MGREDGRDSRQRQGDPEGESVEGRMVEHLLQLLSRGVSPGALFQRALSDVHRGHPAERRAGHPQHGHLQHRDGRGHDHPRRARDGQGADERGCGSQRKRHLRGIQAENQPLGPGHQARRRHPAAGGRDVGQPVHRLRLHRHQDLQQRNQPDGGHSRRGRRQLQLQGHDGHLPAARPEIHTHHLQGEDQRRRPRGLQQRRHPGGAERGRLRLGGRERVRQRPRRKPGREAVQVLRLQHEPAPERRGVQSLYTQFKRAREVEESGSEFRQFHAGDRQKR